MGIWVKSKENAKSKVSSLERKKKSRGRRSKIIAPVPIFYHKTPYERTKTAKATPNREVSEVRARVVGLPAPLLELEEDPVLEGPVVPVFVPLEWGMEEPEECGMLALEVGREA